MTTINAGSMQKSSKHLKGISINVIQILTWTHWLMAKGQRSKVKVTYNIKHYHSMDLIWNDLMKMKQQINSWSSWQSSWQQPEQEGKACLCRLADRRQMTPHITTFGCKSCILVDIKSINHLSEGNIMSEKTKFLTRLWTLLTRYLLCNKWIFTSAIYFTLMFI